MQDEFNSRIEVSGFVVRDGERRNADLHLTTEGIELDGELAAPWNRARLGKDEADGALLIHGKKVTVGSTDPGFLRSIEGLAGNDLDREVAKLTGQTVGWRGSQTVGCLLFFGLFTWGGLAAPGCYSRALDETVAALDPSIDTTLGEAAMESMGEPELIEDPVVVEAVEGIVERLRQHMGEGVTLDPADIDWQVRVIVNEVPNAYALPGGFITVHSALIESATSADMLAGVMAHEMAHVTERHGLLAVANKVGMVAGFGILFGDLGGLTGAAGEVLGAAASSNYSRGLESEADRIGTRTMVRAGLDAKELGKFFQLLKDQTGDIPPAFAWMATHPGHDTRTDAIEAMVEGMDVPDPRPLEIDWAAVQAAISD